MIFDGLADGVPEDYENRTSADWQTQTFHHLIFNPFGNRPGLFREVVKELQELELDDNDELLEVHDAIVSVKILDKTRVAEDISALIAALEAAIKMGIDG